MSQTATSLPGWFAHEFDLSSVASRWPEAAMQPTDPRIRIARSAEDLHAIARLRYDLYIARDGKKYDRANHTSRTFAEPVDCYSLNFFASSDKGVVGAVRLVRAADAINDPHLGLIIEAAQPDDLNAAVVNSRFALMPDSGARALIVPMFQQVYRAGLLAGATACFIATRVELLSLFEKFGYRSISAPFRDRIAGESIV